MENFVFQNPTKLVFGKGTIARLKDLVPDDKRIMVTFGGGSVKTNGVYEQVSEALKGKTYSEFWGIEANPDYATLSKAIAQGKAEKCDFLLAVGGGSVLDGTKLIAAGICYDGDAWDLVAGKAKITAAIPLADVMTMSATGSEMNSGGVISRRETQEKYAFNSPLLFPRFSILDPETTYSLPRFQVACGIIDTFVHTMEQYMTYPVDALVMDRWSEGILHTLFEIGQRAVSDENNYDVMSNYMLTATLALNGFIAMGVPEDWATHMIGHELTALTGLTHGVTLAIILPAMLRVLREQKREKLVQYGTRVLGFSGHDDYVIDESIEKTESFFRHLGIKTRLSDYGIGEDVCNEIVRRWTERNWALGEKGTVTPDVVRHVLIAAN